MKKVHTSGDYLLMGHLRGILESSHVPCLLKHEHLIGGAGDLVPAEYLLELWIVEDFQLEKARSLVRAFLEDRSHDRPGWACSQCGESIEGQFSACWNCGAEGPLDVAIAGLDH